MFRPVKVVAPERTIVNSLPPIAVGGRGATGCYMRRSWFRRNARDPEAREHDREWGMPAIRLSAAERSPGLAAHHAVGVKVVVDLELAHGRLRLRPEIAVRRQLSTGFHKQFLQALYVIAA